jgi:hypothetical protein
MSSIWKPKIRCQLLLNPDLEGDLLRIRKHRYQLRREI